MKQGPYIAILAKDHPHAMKKGYVMEHRIVMEKHLGRYLDPKEFVHHKNGIKTDNRLENLEVVVFNSHLGEVRCPFCQNHFKVR